MHVLLLHHLEPISRTILKKAMDKFFIESKGSQAEEALDSGFKAFMYFVLVESILMKTS